jgi:DNA modification methylase
MGVGVIDLRLGDCTEVLKTLPDNSVQCCITSPPYYGLRDYGHDGQIGLEETPDKYVAKLVEVFGEIRRVLCDNGTLWLNLGDSYSSMNRSGRKESPGVGAKQEIKPVRTHVKWKAGGGSKYQWRIPAFGTELKPKDLIGIPWRVAFALQADGWYLRQDIIWHKPNPMPESVRDRCTKAHEYIFLMSKSARYYFDADAIKEPLASSSIGRAERKQRLIDKNGVGTLGKQASHGIDSTHAYAGLAMARNGKTGYDLEHRTRNRRSVWTISTKPYPGAHFATFPETLVLPCLLAGTKPDDIVIDPFMGSGTVGRVAKLNQRNFIGIELNQDYLDLATKRISCSGIKDCQNQDLPD